ncbi:MAG: hypothetical protein ACTSU7_01650 [Candidatus Heimdallarchaeaceae archaeon]
MVNPILCWTIITSHIGHTGKQFHTWGFYRSQKRPFIARYDGNNILIEAHQLKSRPIRYSEFECVASLYDSYISGDKGIRPSMKKCGYNSSYILTLINEYCV